MGRVGFEPTKHRGIRFTDGFLQPDLDTDPNQSPLGRNTSTRDGVKGNRSLLPVRGAFPKGRVPLSSKRPFVGFVAVDHHSSPHEAVQTGLEPANYTLERRAARPLRFCTMYAV